MEITNYNIGNKLGITLAAVADLHGEAFDEITASFTEAPPDFILIPGDLCPFISAEHNESSFGRKNNHAMEFLEYASGVAPVYYSRGNNEMDWHVSVFPELVRRGIHILENSWQEAAPGFAIGGLASADRKGRFSKAALSTEWLSSFERFDGFKLLLSHHPEYYYPYLRDRRLDLVVSGHAHGGQIRLGNQGLFAPGQGLFPPLTAGMHDERLIISRGASHFPRFIPRINNPTELVYIRL